MSIVDRIKKHWLSGAILLASSCISATWITSTELLVKPRDFTIEQQRATIENLEEKIKNCQAKIHELEKQPISPVTSGGEPEPAPIPCRLNNLINCSVTKPIYSVDRSFSTISRDSSGKTVIDFSNDQEFSGVDFLFTPALDVRGFTQLDISCTVTRKFTLRIEYKARVGSEIKEVTSSDYRDFPATRRVSTIPMPLKYDGTVDEITLMFYVKGQASQVAIESIRLSK